MTKTKRLTELALLTSLALIIFIIELRLPNLCQIPGVKLGLANIITVYAVYRFTPKETAMIVVSRVFLGAVFSGNISALIYSFSGALLCLIGMLAVRKIVPMNYIWICSILGAVFHNFGQIGAAIAVMRSTAVLVYLPVLIISGCIAGAFTGLSAQMILRRFEMDDMNGGTYS